jgi:hypothetical protein
VALSSKSLGSEKSSPVERKRASGNDLLETLLETDRRGAPEGTPKGRAN